MVSPDSSTEGSSSTMDEREKRFYSRRTPSRPPPSSSLSQSQSQSQCQSQSESSEHISNLPQKKTPARTPMTPFKPPPSSGKRSRNEEEEPSNKKPTKPKPTKEDPKKITEDRRKVKQPERVPSPQKSAKKPILWNPKDEIIYLKALAAYCQDGKEFPKNVMTPVYDYVKSLNMLDHDYSNSQLGEKYRRLRGKFASMEEKVKGGGHCFKTAHDETVYKLSKKVWGREEEEEEESEEEESEEKPVKGAAVGNGAKEERAVKKVGQDEEEEVEEDEKDAEEEENKSTGGDLEMTQKENDEVEEEDEEEEANTKQNKNMTSPGLRNHVGVKEAKATPNVASNGTITNVVQDNNGGKLIDQLRIENSAIMKEIKDQLSRENKELKSVILQMVSDGLQGYGNGKASNSIGFSSEEVVNKLSSARELPALDVAEARLLEQKWRRQLLAEMETCSGHLALLQEEFQKRMVKLRSLVDEERH